MKSENALENEKNVEPKDGTAVRHTKRANRPNMATLLCTACVYVPVCLCVRVCVRAKCERVLMISKRELLMHVCICSIIFLSFSSIFIELLSCCAFHTQSISLAHRKKRKQKERKEKRFFLVLSINGCFFLLLLLLVLFICSYCERKKTEFESKKRKFR